MGEKHYNVISITADHESECLETNLETTNLVFCCNTPRQKYIAWMGDQSIRDV